MRRHILLLLFTFIAFVSYAQSPHLKFVGIPLDGSINIFETQLLEKGFAKDTKSNKNAPLGVRFFHGSFIRKPASVVVYFDDKTKNVYGAKSYLNATTKEEAVNEVEVLRDLLSNKYGKRALSIITDEEGLPRLLFDMPNGDIDVYIKKYTDALGLSKEFSVHIQYTDSIGYEKLKKSVLDDL